MSRPGLRAVVFDAYGTLLDVHSAMARHATALGSDWPAISQTWRTKQLEYSWIHSLAGSFRDFAHLTRDALVFAAARHGVHDPALLDQLERSYRALDAYPDAPPALAALRAAGLRCAVLSNGETGMLQDGLRAAGLDDRLDAVLSVDAAQVFKPDRHVYALATTRFGLDPAEIAFVSSNAWDAFGAHQFGFRVVWVNRTGQPVEYDLSTRATTLPDLASLPGALA